MVSNILNSEFLGDVEEFSDEFGIMADIFLNEF
jgi:hypothetical protein